MQLIISTGDICDVDGLLALALYARSGSDLLYIMNYPAYIELEDSLPETESAYGLGYEYGTDAFQSGSVTHGVSLSYTALMASYTAASAREKLKKILTDLAFHMTSNTWSVEASGRFYFCVGGVNDINPYSSRESINEAFIYAPAVDGMRRLGSCEANSLFNIHGESLALDSFLQQYEKIYLDFNGSVAFFDSRWHARLSGCIERTQLKAFFIQGGVLAYEEPHTAPKINGVINRMGCATMNQLYSPMKTGNLLCLMENNHIPVFVVPNNCVENLKARWRAFMISNRVDYAPLSQYTELFYTSPFQLAQKPYDLYSALALVEYVKHGTLAAFSYPKILFFNSKYGISLLHDDETVWDNARADYIVNMRRKLAREAADNSGDVVRQSAVDNFETEARILASVGCMPFSVSLVSFEIDATDHLRLEAHRPRLILLSGPADRRFQYVESVLLIEEGNNPPRTPTLTEIEWILHSILTVTSAEQQRSGGLIPARKRAMEIIDGIVVLSLAVGADELIALNGRALRVGGNDAKKLRLVKLGGISNVVLEESVSLVIGKYIASLGR